MLAATALVALLVLLARGGVPPEQPSLEVVGDPPLEDPQGDAGLPGRPSPGSTGEVEASGWTPTAAAPFDLNVAVPAVWTGEALVVWTGAAQEPGGLYFPHEDRWERLPPAPSERTVGWSAVWTGQEVLYWGGVGPGGQRHGDGVAFAPAERSWRRVPDAPIEGRMGAAAVATPHGVVVWGGERPRGPDGGQRMLSDGATYDPRGHAWTLLPVVPLSPRTDAVAVWTGTHVLLWGGRGGPQGQDGWLNDGALYDLDAGDWHRIDALPVAFSFPPAVAWSGEQLLVWGLPAEGLHLPDGWAFDVATGRWSELPSLLNQERASATAAWLSTASTPSNVAQQPPLVVWGGLDRRLREGRMDGFALDPATHRWRQVPPANLTARLQPAIVWTGDRLLVWGGRWRASVFTDGAVYRP